MTLDEFMHSDLISPTSNSSKLIVRDGRGFHNYVAQWFGDITTEDCAEVCATHAVPSYAGDEI